MEADRKSVECIADLRENALQPKCGQSPSYSMNNVLLDVSAINKDSAIPRGSGPKMPLLKQKQSKRSSSIQAVKTTTNFPRRSASLGGQSSKKKIKRRKGIQRTVRPRDELEIEDLSEQMESYFALYKRDPTQIFDVVDAGLQEEHKGNYLPSQTEMMIKPRCKDNRHSEIKTISFKSIRGEYRIPLLLDTDCVRVDKEHVKLRYLYNEGIFNEDNDTDDSGRERGVEKTFKFLQHELENRKGARKAVIRQIGLNKRSQLSTVTPASTNMELNSETPLLLPRRDEIKLKPSHRGAAEYLKTNEKLWPVQAVPRPATTGLKKLKGSELGASPKLLSRPVDTAMAELGRKESWQDNESGKLDSPLSQPGEGIGRRDSNSMEEENPTDRVNTTAAEQGSVTNASGPTEGQMYVEPTLGAK